MEQENMINEIINFVGKYHESTASIAVFRNILGSYPGEINETTLVELQNKLRQTDPEELESMYYIIK
jgi:hypothetical protein